MFEKIFSKPKEFDPSRREFIKKTAGAAAFAATPEIVKAAENMVETKETKTEKLEQRLIDIFKKAQEAGIVKYNGGREMGWEPACNGKIGKYNMECLFRYFPDGYKEGEITGEDHENLIINFRDENDTSHEVTKFFKEFRGTKLNLKPQEGLETIDRKDLAEKGFIIHPKHKEAYYKEMEPEEIESMLNNFEIEFQKELEKNKE